MVTASTDADEENQAGRHVAAVFEKFERDVRECQELLCQASSQWLSSSDESRPAAEPPPGIIASMEALPQSRVILLVPADDSGFAGILDMREVR